MFSSNGKSVARKAAGVAAGALLLAMTSPAGSYAAPAPTIKLGTAKTATCTRTYTEICFQPSSGNDITARVNLGRSFTKAGLNVALVCLTFVFTESDPLSPGEELQVYGYGGFSNIGGSDTFTRKLCLSDYGDLNLLEEFQDGKATLHFLASTGSFELASVSVDYTAVPL
jgi:hypothetical protein